jgi:hypothetical protein
LTPCCSPRWLVANPPPGLWFAVVSSMYLSRCFDV